MDFIVVNISPESNFDSINDDLNSEYRDSLFGRMTIIIDGHSETVEYMFFLELQRQLCPIITGQSLVANYYDIDDFGLSYRKDNNPYIRFFVEKNLFHIKFRWNERIYSCSFNEFEVAYERYLKQLKILLTQYGVDNAILYR